MYNMILYIYTKICQYPNVPAYPFYIIIIINIIILF